MSSLRPVDLSLIDEILRGGVKGYGLDFSNRTFGDFFVRELDINIDAPRYITFSSGKDNELKIRGIDKQAAGELAAKIRRIRPPDH